MLCAPSCAILVTVTGVIVSSQWERLKAEDLRGTVMLIGDSDTGKSALAQFLLQCLARQGIPAAYLDTDLGQSTLGLPTTLNVALAGAGGAGAFPPKGARAAFFVGSTTPRGHMLPTVIGAHRLQQKALALGAQSIVVDTTGLVDSSQGGTALKQWKIELLAPQIVIGLQRHQELEPILWPLRRDKRLRCIELQVSSHAIERTRQERVDYRRERLAQYFQSAMPCLVSLRTMAVYDLGLMAVGALLALQDAEGFALGLGVVERAERAAGNVVIYTPMSDLAGVESLRFGAARWDLTHQREG